MPGQALNAPLPAPVRTQVDTGPNGLISSGSQTLANIAVGMIVPILAKNVLRFALRHPLKATLGAFAISAFIQGGRKSAAPRP